MIKGNLIKLIKVFKVNFFILYEFLTKREIMGDFQNTYNFSFVKLKNKILNNHNIKYFLIRNLFDKKIIGFVYYKIKKSGTAEIGGTIIPMERNKNYGFNSYRALIKFLVKKKI